MERRILFSTILFERKKELGLTLSEYIILDVICNLQESDGWCYSDVDYISEIMDISKQATQTLIKGLKTNEWIEIEENKKRVTSKWRDVISIKAPKKEPIPKIKTIKEKPKQEEKIEDVNELFEIDRDEPIKVKDKISIESLYNILINSNNIEWQLDLKLENKKTWTAEIHSKYIYIIKWWLDNFPKEIIDDFLEKYVCVRHDLISSLFIDWICRDKKNIRIEPLKTLKKFYENKVKDQSFIGYNVSSIIKLIDEDNYEWNKHLALNPTEGTREDYIKVLEWWTANIPENISKP